MNVRRLATSSLAALMSALLPGVGQALAGRAARGLGFALALAAAGLLALVGVRQLPSAAGIVVPVGLLVGVRLWAAIDAARIIARTASTPVPRRVAAIALVLGVALALEAGVSAARRQYLGASFRLPAGSMAPTLLEGEYLITVPLAGERATRGQVVAFRWPEDTARSFVKRIVGTPSDTLSMRAGALYRNSDPVREPYAHHTEPGLDRTGDEFRRQQPHLANRAGVESVEGAIDSSRNNWGPLVVPRGMYFVLGDNRDNSLDSRYWGFVSAEHIFARPHRVYFSRDLATGRVRWERIGHIVQAPRG